MFISFGDASYLPSVLLIETHFPQQTIYEKALTKDASFNYPNHKVFAGHAERCR
jgi:hypothetical protein